MSDKQIERQKGQSIVIVAVAMVALVLFVAITVDMSEAYHLRRVAQNAADAAALAGAQELGRQLNGKSPSDPAIDRTMNDYGERNGIEDTNDTLADEVNDNVEGWYLDKNKSEIAQVGTVAKPPKQAIGIRARTHITAPTFFGGIFGLAGLSLEAQAAVYFETACTGAPCMLPIAIHEMLFDPKWYSDTTKCFNMWDGDGAGNFGWLNWSLQNAAYSCQDDSVWGLGITDTLTTIGITNTLPDDCSADCLVINMDPDACGRIDPQNFNMDEYGNIWIGGSPGVQNADNVVARLVEFIETGTVAKIVVYDRTQGKGGCGKDDNPKGFQYHLSGFACFRITGFRLNSSNGARECDLMTDGNVHCQDCSKVKDETGEWQIQCPPGVGTYEADPGVCIDNPGTCEDVMKIENCTWETGEYARITGYLVPCIGGDYGNCKAVGNLLAPRLDE